MSADRPVHDPPRRPGRFGWLRRPGAALALLLALVVLAIPGGAASARQSGGAIGAYRAELTVTAAGELRVFEEIEYTLAPGESHGLRRFVPLKVDYDDRYRRVYAIDDVQVSAEPAGGTVLAGPASGVDDLATNVDNDQLVIRIGSAETFIEGTWRYRIGYTVHDAIETVELRDIGAAQELVWNVVGTAWTVPIERLDARLVYPATPLSSRCYTGRYRAEEACVIEGDGTEADPARISVAGLEPGEAVTVYADLPVGTVERATAVLEERWTLARAFRATPVTLALSALGSLAAIGGLGTLLGRQARDRRLATTAYLPADAEPDRTGLAGFFDKPDGPVQFRPPDGMTPGLGGVLVDERADPLDVSATIVDLAIRGHLQIEQREDSGAFRRHSDFHIRFLDRADETLHPYERLLLDGLRAHAAGRPGVLLSELRTKFAGELSAVRSAMYDETMARRWFTRRPDRVRSAWIGIGVLVLILGGVAAAALIALTTYGLLSLPAVLPGLLILGAAGRMPSRTGEGRRLLELLVGYERFLEVADVDELRYADRQHDFVAGLPYAMVFGITHRWAAVLAVLQQQGVDLAPTWYIPINPGGVFRYDDFGRSMSDFNSVSAAALSAPQPSSTGGGFSGGGGGGFSGGGGGGGGGGGW
ncbi:MAG: DUF2207 domain-containing protein [Acidimicrobiales bacterium]|nr:DUF2207 domain-containing protein [Acidimicrobiales bacterium]